MKKFTKVLALGLVLATITGATVALTACNKGNTESEPVIKMIDVELAGEEYGFALPKTAEGDALKVQVGEIFADKADEIEAIKLKYFNASADELATFGANYSTEDKYDDSTDAPSTDKTYGDNQLVVATNLDFAPFEYKNGSKIAGIDMEIAKLIADELDKELVVVHMNFDAVVTAVQTIDTYDIGMAGLTITDERKAQVNFTDAYIDTAQVVVTKADSTLFDGIDNADDLNAKLATLADNQAKCGGQKGTTGFMYMKGDDSMGYDGFANLNVKGYANYALAVTDVVNGNIEFVVIDKPVGEVMLKQFNI